MVNSFALFCDCPWQWVSLGMGGTLRTGLLRSELEASARSLGIATEQGTVPPHIFADVRVMEAAAIQYWARKR